MAALFAINTISERIERSSVESRLEHESLQSARVGSFRVVEQMSAISAPEAEGYLQVPEDPAVTDRFVLNAFTGQSVVRVDIVGPDDVLAYSTDPTKRGLPNTFDEISEPAGSDYIGPAMMSPVSDQPHASEVVVSKVPIPREGSGASDAMTEYTFLVYRDVTSAIDAATESSNQFRLLMVFGVMAVLFVSLLGVVWRGHSLATSARRQLQLMLENERELAAELDTRAEEMKAAVDSKNHVLSVVTHELNNPITVIAAYSDVMANNRNGNLSERDVKKADAISRSARQLGNLVSDLLDYSRIEAHTIELDVGEYDVMALARDAAETIAPILDGRNQSLELTVESDPVMAQLDCARCEQVLMNLLSNASKYSPEGSTVSLRCEATDDRIAFVVTDQGMGISLEDQRKLFQPFFRAENAETRNVKGTGLGLMISRQLAELHGGSLTVESAVGRGTTVSFVLPRNPA